MSGWIEERAASLREQCGGDTGRLIEVLTPGVTVRWTQAMALCLHYPGGRAVVYAPDDGPDLLEEVGHALGTAGLGMELERQGAPWARLQLWRDEAIARRFREEWEAESAGPDAQAR